MANRTGVRAGNCLLEFVARGGNAAGSGHRARIVVHPKLCPPGQHTHGFRSPSARCVRADPASGRRVSEQRGGTAAFCLAVQKSVDVQRCVVLEAAEQVAAPSPPFIAVTSPRTRVDFGDSLIVRRSLEGFVSRWSASHPSPAEYQPVTIRDSRLVLDEAPPPGASPDGYRLERSPVEARPGSCSSNLYTSPRGWMRWPTKPDVAHDRSCPSSPSSSCHRPARAPVRLRPGYTARWASE